MGHKCFGDLHCYGNDSSNTAVLWIMAAVAVVAVVALIVNQVRR